MKLLNSSARQFVMVLLLFATAVCSLAQDGKLAVQATPKHAYVFVDGRALGESKHIFTLSPGDHKLDVVNYGFKAASQTVSITAGQTTHVPVTLTPITDTVNGPWGALTIEGADHDAVLLNGKTPDFFVGQGDEFDHNWWWKQELVVPPGNYQMTVLSSDKEIWSGPVEVTADNRTVVDVPKGVRKTVPWSRGQKLSPTQRFTVGTASATVAVAKPTAQLAANAANINCGDTSQLTWSSTDAPQVAITPVGNVAVSGQQGVQPTQTTNYQLTALGPGGTATSMATVNVNTAVQANLSVSPAEVRYRKVGDNIVEQGNPTLTWSAQPADKVTIDAVGAVSASGTQNVTGVPKRTDPGPVDETLTYTLTASNPCGGTATQTATLHILGAIEAPDNGLAINSVYFPTNRPRRVSAKAGLLDSQQTTLNFIADSFKQYLQNKPDARLTVTGHADKRGTTDYNRELSQRRADVAKAYLVAQGVPEDHIDTQSAGDDQNLTADQVKELVEQNPNLSDEERQKVMEKMKTLVYANNRRVDLMLSPNGRESVRQYPFKAADYATLIDRNAETGSGVQMASKREKAEN